MNYESENSKEYLMFKVNDRFFSVELHNIVSIIQATQPLPIPEYPDYVLGTVSVDNTCLPVIDARRRFRYETKPITNRNCIIITECDNRRAGILVDEVQDFKMIDDDKILPPPNLNTDASTRYLSGEFLMDGDVPCYIVNPIKMFDADDEDIIPVHDNSTDE